MNTKLLSLILTITVISVGIISLPDAEANHTGSTINPPTNVRASMINDTRFLLIWDPVTPQSDHPFSHYIIKYVDQNNHKVTLTTTITFIWITNLQPNTVYTISLATVDTNNDVSAFTTFHTRTISLPDPPTNLTVNQLNTNGSVTLSWDAPLSTHIPITTYDIQFKDINASEWEYDLGYLDTRTTRDISGDHFKDTHYYEFRVKSANTMGFSPYSNQVELLYCETTTFTTHNIHETRHSAIC